MRQKYHDNYINAIFIIHDDVSTIRGYDRIKEIYPTIYIDDIGKEIYKYFEIRSYITLLKQLQNCDKIILITKRPEFKADYQIFNSIEELKLYLLTIKIAGVLK